MDNNSNLPMKRNESIFYKIKEWFRKLFNKDEIIEEQTENNNEEEKTTERSTFVNSIKFESKDVILALQRKLRNQEIEIDDLTDKELYEMVQLYGEQIEEKKNKVEKQIKDIYKDY